VWVEARQELVSPLASPQAQPWLLPQGVYVSCETRRLRAPDSERSWLLRISLPRMVSSSTSEICFLSSQSKRQQQRAAATGSGCKQAGSRRRCTWSLREPCAVGACSSRLRSVHLLYRPRCPASKHAGDAALRRQQASKYREQSRWVLQVHAARTSYAENFAMILASVTGHGSSCDVIQHGFAGGVIGFVWQTALDHHLVEVGQLKQETPASKTSGLTACAAC